jgi:hypothetical protein
MKKFLSIIFLSIVAFANAQDKSIPEKKTLNGFFAIDYLSIDMPTNDLGPDEHHMGFSGVHYNLNFDNLYAGLGMYGSVRGERGGFFTLGVNLGYRSFLMDKLFIDTGIHFGGGGGAGAPDGGGAFLLPHLNLGHDFGKFSLTAGYSYINFFDAGKIKSHQLNFGLQVPIAVDYVSAENADQEFNASELKKSAWNKTARRMSFMLHLNNLSANGNSQNSLGESLVDTTIRLAGFEINSYMNDDWFLFAKFDGAYDGIRAGYMNILLGVGYHFGFNQNRTNILTKFGMGAGGGGSVETKGGMLMYPDISIEQHISNNIYLSVNKGFLMSPDAFFESSTFGVGLKYYTNINGVKNLEDSTKVRFKGFQIIVKQDMYLDAKRMIQSTEDLHQIAVQLNYFLNKNIYLAGQTAFANFGNAGAYAEGIVGMGVQTNRIFNKKVSLFLQALAGGAGGGDISTGEGLIFKPSAGLNYQLNSGFALRGAVGYVKARGGELSSPMINLGLSYRFAFLSSK